MSRVTLLTDLALNGAVNSAVALAVTEVVPLSRYCPGDGIQDDRPGLVAAHTAYPSGSVRFVGAVGATYRFDIAAGQSLSPPANNIFYDFSKCSVRMGGANGRTTDRIFDVNAKTDVHIMGGRWLQALSDGTSPRTDGRVVFSNCTRCSFEPETIDARDASGLNNNVFTCWLSGGTDNKVRGEHAYGTLLVAGGTNQDIDVTHVHGPVIAGVGQNSITMQDTDALRLRNPTVRATIRDCARWGVEIVPSGTGDWKTRSVDAYFPRLIWTDPGATAFGVCSAVVAGSKGGSVYMENVPFTGIECSAVGQMWDLVTAYWDPTFAGTTGTAITYGPATTSTFTSQVPRGGTEIGLLKTVNCPQHSFQVGSSGGASTFWGRPIIHALDALDCQGHAIHTRDNGGLSQSLGAHIHNATIRYTKPPRVGGDRQAFVPGDGTIVDVLSVIYEAGSVTAGTDNDIVINTAGPADVEIGTLELVTARVDAHFFPTFNSGAGVRTGWKIGRIRITGGTTVTFPFSFMVWYGEGTASWTPTAALADGAVATTTLAVTGAKLGDPFVASLSNAVAVGVMLSAAVTSAGNVGVTLFNKTGAPLTQGTVTVRVARVGSN